MNEFEALLVKWKAEAKANRKPTRAFGQHPGPYLSNYRETNCSRCGRQFFALGDGVSYCSSRCQQDDRNERRREQRAQQRALHKRELGKCAVCGKLVDQVRSTLRYCSNACRQKAYRSAKLKRAKR
jgi:hypothetical protein